MKPNALVLIGGPDSGKTNYLARLWEALRHGEGALVAPNAPEEIQYVEDALAHLLQGSFAPRSSKGPEGRDDVTIPVRASSSDTAPVVEVVVPDVNGELWKSAVEAAEIDIQWMELLTNTSGALLFVRILSDQNVQPLDWVMAARLLKLGAKASVEQSAVPTQVMLCELLRFLEIAMRARSDGLLPRVSVLVTAWDRLDKERSDAGPCAFLTKEYPLFAAKIGDVSDTLSVRVFGVSVVGGDLDIDEEFREQFFEGRLADCGYVIFDSDGATVRSKDLTLPVAWLLNGLE